MQDKEIIITQNSYYFVHKNFLEIFLKKKLEIIFVRERKKSILNKYLEIFNYFNFLNSIKIILLEIFYYFKLKKKLKKLDFSFTSDFELNKYLISKLKKKNYKRIISIGCPCYIDPNIQREFKLQIYNIHGGIIPFQRGRYSPIKSLLKRHNILGSTIHLINKEFDNGTIISQDYFFINNYNFLSNYQRVLKLSSRLLEEFLKDNYKHLPNQIKDYFLNFKV